MTRGDNIRRMLQTDEGYTDNTAGQAVHEADRPPDNVREAIKLMRNFGQPVRV